jgi:hypothetical protein
MEKKLIGVQLAIVEDHYKESKEVELMNYNNPPRYKNRDDFQSY